MQMFKILTTSATLILGANSVAFAQSDHGHGTQQPDIAAGSNNGRSSPMVADQHEMMQKMMKFLLIILFIIIDILVQKSTKKILWFILKLMLKKFKNL